MSKVVNFPSKKEPAAALVWPSIPPAYRKDGSAWANDHVCTDEELAEICFDGVPEFRTDGVGVSTPEFRDQLEDYLRHIIPGFKMALVVLGYSKDDLVEKVAMNEEFAIYLADWFKDVREKLLHLSQLVQSAEIRQVSAIASFATAD